MSLPLKDLESKTHSSKSDQSLECKSIDKQLPWKNVPSTSVKDTMAVVFLPWFSTLATIVSKLDNYMSKIQVYLGGKDCTFFKITSRNAISFGHVSSCGTIEDHLTLFKERHLLDGDRVDGIFSPQPRRRDTILVIGTRF